MLAVVLSRQMTLKLLVLVSQLHTDLTKPWIPFINVSALSYNKKHRNFMTS